MKKRLFSCALAVLLVVCTAPIALAATDTPYYNWKQYDAQWASVTLYKQSMKEVGCLATSVAMLAVQLGLCSEKEFDPGVFAADMRKADGFTADDDLIWEKLPAAVQGLRAENAWAALSGTQAEKNAKLKQYLGQGYGVAVAVKSGGHWVALRGTKDGRVTMMDPASTATDLFEKYAASGVSRVALLRGDTPKICETTQAITSFWGGDVPLIECIFDFMKDIGAFFEAIMRYVMLLGK